MKNFIKEILIYSIIIAIITFLEIMLIKMFQPDNPICSNCSLYCDILKQEIAI